MALRDGATLRAVTADAEIRRLRYLQAMGIDVCISRRALPGAQATRYLGLRDAVANTPSSYGASHAGDRLGSAAARSALKQSLGDARRTGERTSQEHSRRASAPPAENSAATERFSLAAVVTASRLWVEDLGDQALARDQVQLMAAIGRALDHPDIEDRQAHIGQFNWPMLENAQLALGADEATAALDGFLSRQLGDHNCKALMCLGETAAKHLASLQLSVPVYFLPASRELLVAPVGKRALWQSLRS